MHLPKKVICIKHPANGHMDVIKATLKHKVIIEKTELFDKNKDYATYTYNMLHMVDANKQVLLMFIFNNGESMLADSQEKVDIAVSEFNER